jgi:hypothetical protein
MRRAAFIVLAAVVSSACVKTVELSPGVEPAPASAGRSSEAAGVVCAPGLLAYVERANFHKFALGEPLCGALTRSVERSYRSAQRTESPYKGQYGRVIRFYLNSSALDVRRLPDGSIRASYSVGVAVETCGRDLQPQARKLVTGNAVITRRDMGSGDIVKEAAEAALAQVADNTSRLLVAGIDGPRIREAVPAAPER